MISKFLARCVVRRPGLVAALLLGSLLASGWIIGRHARFDTEILNLLPSENQAVSGLKRYNQDFSQIRELAFLIEGPGVDSTAEAHAKFVGMLRDQPWVVRVLESSPERAEGFLTPAALAPLILNLPEPEFAGVREALKPDAVRERVRQLSQRVRAGSPAAAAVLSVDPLGVAAPAISRALATISLEESFQMESPDGLAYVVPVVTSQSDASADASRAIMAEVRAFLDEARARLGPEITVGVTGRSAYVEEIAASMERDLRLTSMVSGLGVLIVFWLGFRRLLPLAGIGIILSATAAATLSAGMLALGQLNLIAISFCSILFGLGDDFSLLLCQRFYRARAEGNTRTDAIARSLREAMPGIFWVALTTAIGFLALCFSGSRGMAQLGALVATGILICTIFMSAFLFLFLFGKSSPEPASTGPVAPFLRLCERTPRAGRLVGVFATLLLVAVAALPWRPLGFDLSPASLEPREISAARTLARMLERFPGTFEPVMLILDRPDPRTLDALDQVLAELREENLATSISSPSGLFLDPARARANAAGVTRDEWDAAQAAWEEAASQEGLSEEVTASAGAFIESLADPSTATSSWQDVLEEDSPWWFVIDRMLAPGGEAAIAYFKAGPALTMEGRVPLAERIRSAVPGTSVTGWTQSLASLVPWAVSELLTFGSAVVLLILAILACVYRNWRMWIVHIGALAFGIAGTLVFLKFCNTRINLLNVLAFPLILAVGVDYGTHVLLAAREAGRSSESLAGVVKAVALSALTTATGFGALALASNPALSGLGWICASGVIWSLLGTLIVIVPFATRLSGETGVKTH